MAYGISCRVHGILNASSILDLIEHHTDNRFGNNGGTIICPKCKKPATIFREYELQEKGQTWKCWVNQVVRIPSDIPTYVPYVLFTKGEEAGKTSYGVMVSYYKDTRHEIGGRLKHGHGPGGPAVMGKSELLSLIGYLIEAKVILPRELQNLLKKAKSATV